MKIYHLFLIKTMSNEIKDNIKLDINKSTKFINTYNLRNKFNYCTNEICKVEGCNNPVQAKGYCPKHYFQINKYGKISNTIYDKNEIIIKDNYAIVVVKDKFGNKKGETFIDIDDIDKVHLGKVGMYNDGYFYINFEKHTRYRLNRYILGLTDCYDKHYQVDHIDRNPANNRKSNLRYVTSNVNARNKSSNKYFPTDIDNIYKSKANKFIYSFVCIGKRYYCRKEYDNIDDCIKEYKRKYEEVFNRLTSNFKVVL